MKFPTQYDKFERTHCSSGSGVKKRFSPTFDDEGKFSLVESGEVNVYEEIQSHRDSVDINVLLLKYLDGDTAALERVQGMYGDFSNMPNSYAGILNTMTKSRAIFDSLPADIRSNFDNSFEQFISSMDNPDIFNQLVARKDTTNDKVKAKVEKEVTE